MLTVSKGELKAKMLGYFRRVERTGEELIVTDRRVPVLKVVALVVGNKPEDLFGKYRGKVKYHGDILSPETGEWGEV